MSIRSFKNDLAVRYVIVLSCEDYYRGCTRSGVIREIKWARLLASFPSEGFDDRAWVGKTRSNRIDTSTENLVLISLFAKHGARDQTYFGRFCHGSNLACVALDHGRLPMRQERYGSVDGLLRVDAHPLRLFFGMMWLRSRLDRIPVVSCSRLLLYLTIH